MALISANPSYKKRSKKRFSPLRSGLLLHCEIKRTLQMIRAGRIMIMTRYTHTHSLGSPTAASAYSENKSLYTTPCEIAVKSKNTRARIMHTHNQRSSYLGARYLHDRVRKGERKNRYRIYCTAHRGMQRVHVCLPLHLSSRPSAHVCACARVLYVCNASVKKSHEPRGLVDLNVLLLNHYPRWGWKGRDR